MITIRFLIKVILLLVQGIFMILQTAKSVEWPFAKGEDPSSWLKVKVSALEGPFASTSWIKHVLRELVSIQRVFRNLKLFQFVFIDCFY